MEERLSEYERVRLENIKKNEEFLRNLELSSIKETLATDSRTISRSPSSCHTRKKRKVVCCDDESVQSAPLRRSIRGLAGVELLSEGTNSVTYMRRPAKRGMSVQSCFTDDGDERIQITADELRNFIVDSSVHHFEQLSDEQIQHCAYRMSYMSHKQLVTRLNAIGKFATKHSHDKLLVFYYALCLSRLVHLAKAARLVLEDIGVVFDDHNEGSTGGASECAE